MEEAVEAMQNLAQQCSDPTAVQDIVTHLFKILGGELTSCLLVGNCVGCFLKHIARSAYLSCVHCGYRV